MTAITSDNPLLAITRENIEAASKSKEMAEGAYMAVLRDLTYGQSKAGSWMFTAEVEILRDASDTSSGIRKQKTYIVVPDQNKHTETGYSFLLRRLLAFVHSFGFEDVPAGPTFVKGQSRQDRQDAITAANVVALQKAAWLAANTEEVKNAVLNVRYGYKRDSEKNFVENDKGYKEVEINFLSPELPAGVSYVDPAATFV